MGDSAKLTPGNWVSIAGLIVALLGMAGGISLYVYATKSDVVSVKETCSEKAMGNRSSIEVLQTHQSYQTTELSRVQARLENMDAQQQVDSKNLERLLERFRVKTEDAPTFKPIPAAKPAPPPMDRFQ